MQRKDEYLYLVFKYGRLLITKVDLCLEGSIMLYNLIINLSSD